MTGCNVGKAAASAKEAFEATRSTGGHDHPRTLGS
jgi:hypothetical protein